MHLWDATPMSLTEDHGVQAAASAEIDIRADQQRQRMLGLMVLGEIQEPWEKYIRTEDPEDIPGEHLH